MIVIGRIGLQESRVTPWRNHLDVRVDGVECKLLAVSGRAWPLKVWATKVLPRNELGRCPCQCSHGRRSHNPPAQQLSQCQSKGSSTTSDVRRHTLHLSTSNDGAGQRGAEKVALLVDGIALNSTEAQLLDELLTEILDDPVNLSVLCRVEMLHGRLVLPCSGGPNAPW